MSDPTEGTITFADRATVPLAAGDYTIQVTQRVELSGRQTEAYRASQSFSVAGQRDMLAPETIQALYPPPASQGAFATTLPHVVLTQPSLPWQRSPGGPPPAQGQPQASWLAVLLFDAADPPPVAQVVKRSSLATKGTLFVPPHPQQQGESLEDPITVIDVPITLFMETAPALADVGWLAHVRLTSAERKASEAEARAPTEYSVVLGNRLPAAGTVSSAFLVSLEGVGPYLPEASQPAFPGGSTSIRLIVLASWTFGTEGTGATFEATLREDTKVGALQRVPTPVSPSTPETGAVAKAMELGYTGLEHGLRNGERTVSWYRGPLLALATTATLTPPYRSPDQLLRFDPTSGMFDITYSAAWTLGRLLALHDSAFAAALYRWKLTKTHNAIDELERKLLDEALTEVLEQAGIAHETAQHRMVRAVRGLLSPALDALAAKEGAG